MKLSEVLNISRHSELNTLAVKDNNEALVSFVNLGILELYSQFALDSEEFIIPLRSDRTIYDLPHDFMYLVSAYESYGAGLQGSVNLPVNNENDPSSVNTINFRQVQIPNSQDGKYVGIIYVKKPDAFTVDDLDKELPLPDQLIQPLLNFMAFKGHSAVRLDGQGEGDIYYLRFKKSCDDILKQGTSIASDDLNMDTRIHDRGFP